MSREIAIRIPSEIGAYVREQPRSSTDTVMALAGDLYKRRQRVTLADPGPGEDRIKLRLEQRVIQFVRAGTRSRDTTAAIRKLLRWGYEGRALASAPVRASLAQSAPSTAIVQREPVPFLPVRRPLGGRPAWLACRNPRTPEEEEQYRLFLVSHMPACTGETALAPYGPPSLPASDSPGLSIPAPICRVIERLPVSVLAIGIPVAFLCGGYFLLKWLAGLSTAAKVVAGTAGAAAAALTVAAWTPQAAAGLGALFL